MARKKPWHNKEFEFTRKDCPKCERTLLSIMMAGSFFAGEEVICMRCWTERDRKRKKWLKQMDQKP